MSTDSHINDIPKGWSENFPLHAQGLRIKGHVARRPVNKAQKSANFKKRVETKHPVRDVTISRLRSDAGVTENCNYHYGLTFFFNSRSLWISDINSRLGKCGLFARDVIFVLELRTKLQYKFSDRNLL